MKEESPTLTENIKMSGGLINIAALKLGGAENLCIDTVGGDW